MQGLSAAIPDPAVLLALEPEELGAKMLFILRTAGSGKFHPGNMLGDLWRDNAAGHPSYPREREHEITIAVTEAWAWLEAQGLIIPEPGYNGQNGWRLLSRRAMKFESEANLADFAAARLLPRELLHPTIAELVWMSFIRGDFSTAIFQAMRAVEIAVREASHFPAGDHGVPMIRRAFNVDNGRLTDRTADPAEREALMHLFSGAIGSYKNPHSHRNVDVENPSEAARVIMLASHLLSIVDGRERAPRDTLTR